MSDELVLVARGRRISGWTSASVTLKCDGFPGQFDIAMTWRDPLTKGAVIAAAGDDCQVYIGGDLVISGYIDEDIAGGDKAARSLQITGRGKCQDLVDCGAEWHGGQMIGGTALVIAQNLAQAYGIEVTLGPGASAGPAVPQWALDFTETPAAIIQRVAQNAGLLAYEDTQGRLLLAQVGAERAASGASYGVNVERWSVGHSMHERYSDVLCASLGTDTLGDLNGSNFFASARDPNVPRHRQIVVVLQEVAEDAQAFTERKANWVVTRALGRSSIVSVTIDSWRDKGGKLWTPNTLVPIDLPYSRLPDRDLVLGQVTFRRDLEGTHADLVLMPREAFAIEPINLLPTATADLRDASQP